MATGNDYGGLIDPREVELIAWRARCFGFREDEMADLEQEIVPKLIKARFRGNGRARRRTFVVNIINRQISKIRRDRQRGPRRVSFEAVPLEAMGEDSLPRVDGIDLLCLRLDLEDALNHLSAKERSICISLLRGECQAEIARKLGVATQTVNEKVARLARKLRRWGLDSYCRKSRIPT
ncbi:MAG: sigma-70 family RNA polymerase sigma factor [Planctomycetota bacterium]|jgi:RNA polymerase sigma factor (sigma-70 family)